MRPVWVMGPRGQKRREVIAVRQPPWRPPARSETGRGAESPDFRFFKRRQREQKRFVDPKNGADKEFEYSSVVVSN